MASTSTQDTSEPCFIIRTNTDKFFEILRNARDLERQNKINLALLEYEKCLTIIDDVLMVSLPRSTNPNSQWIAADNTRQYLKAEKKEILNKIVELQKDNGFTMYVDRPIQSPPTYQETICSDEQRSNASDHHNDTNMPKILISYNQLNSMLSDLQRDLEKNSSTTLLFSCSDSQIFFIPIDGQVSSPLEKSTVKIIMLEGINENIPARYFLCVDDIYYPLVQNVSPCLRTNYGAFVFPDIQTSNTSIGVLVPSEHLDQLTDILEDILQKSLRTDSAREQGRKISAHIVKGATFFSNSLVKGAEKTSEFINNSTPGLLNYITPAQHEKCVNQKVEKGIKTAKSVTATAASVTCFFAEKIGSASYELGKYLAPHIQKGGTKILSGVTGMNSNDASRQVSNALDIAAGTIEGFGIVYDGLEKSGILLGSSIKNNTVLIVRHKYGHNIGVVTEDTFDTVGHGIWLTKNIKDLKPKNIVKNTAKQTGRALVVPEND